MGMSECDYDLFAFAYLLHFSLVLSPWMLSAYARERNFRSFISRSCVGFEKIRFIGSRANTWWFISLHTSLFLCNSLAFNFDRHSFMIEGFPSTSTSNECIEVFCSFRVLFFCSLLYFNSAHGECWALWIVSGSCFSTFFVADKNSFMKKTRSNYD